MSKKKGWYLWGRVDTPVSPICNFMVDTSQSGRLVTLCLTFFSQHNALLIMNSIGCYIFKLQIFLKVTLNPSWRFLSFILVEIYLQKKVPSVHFLIQKILFIIFSLFLIYSKLVQWFFTTNLFNPPIDTTNWSRKEVHYFDFGSTFSSMILFFEYD